MNRTVRNLLPALAVLLVIFLTLVRADASPAPGAGLSESGCAEHQVIVAFRPEAVTEPDSMDQILRASLGKDYTLVDPLVIDSGLKAALVASGRYRTKELIGLLSRNKDIVSADPNYLKSPLGYDTGYNYSLNDPLNKYSYQLNPPAARNTNGTGVSSFGRRTDNVVSTNAGGLWPANPDTGREVVVAVLDSGINRYHEDLKDVLWHNPGNIGLEGDIGYNFAEGGTDVTDTVGHGTHCAGIIAAAANNGKGIAGIGAGVNVKIMILANSPSKPITEDTDASQWDSYRFIKAMNYVLQAKRRGVNVVATSNSWGYGPGGYVYDEMLTKLGEEGIVNFFAAGNDCKDLDAMTDGPADTENPYALKVGAVDAFGKPAGFSNHGMTSTAFYAPGVNILSCAAETVYFPNLYTWEERRKTTEFYGQFTSATRIQGNTVVPESGDPDVKPFGALEMHAQLINEEADPSDLSRDTKLELSIDTDHTFTTDAMMKVTLRNAQAGAQYFLFFPFEKNPATTGRDNTQFSMLAFRAFEEGDMGAILRGGEIVLNEDGRYEVVAEGTYEYSNLRKDDGTAIHIRPEMENAEAQLVLSAEELGNRRIGLGICVTPSIPDDPNASMYGDIHFYIDSLGVSIPDAPLPDENHSYAIQSGTSMAAPSAAGCYALVAGRNPPLPGQSGADYSKAMIAKFLSAIQQNDALAALCSTGGMVDLSLLEDTNPSVSDAVCDVEAGTLTLSGQALTDEYRLGFRSLSDSGKITWLPSGSLTPEYSEDGQTLVISNAWPLFNTAAQFVVARSDTVIAKSAYFLVKGQPAPEKIHEEHTEMIRRVLLTDQAEETLYAYEMDSGTVSRWDGSQFCPVDGSDLQTALKAYFKAKGYSEEQMDDRHLTISVYRHESVLAAEGKVYEFAELTYIPDPDTSYDDYTKWFYLASMDYCSDQPSWNFREIENLTDAAEREVLTGTPDTFAVMDGKIFCFGAESESEKPFTFVLCLDMETGLWTQGRNMSEIPLSSGYTAVMDGKIYLLGALEGTRDALSRRVYSYDGDKWQRLRNIPFAGRHLGLENEENGRILAGIAAVDHGLMICNSSAEGCGNFYLYDTGNGELLPLYLTLTDGRTDPLTSPSAVRVGDWIWYTAMRENLDKDFCYELYRIPYRHLYTLDKEVYGYVTGSGESLRMAATRSSLDRLTFDRFRRLTVDGKAVPPAFYRTARGSLVLTPDNAWLDTLETGEHRLVFEFADGTAEAYLTVRAAAPFDPTKFEDVAVPSASFTFKTQWKGSNEQDIGFTLYKLGGTVYRHGFDRQPISQTEVRYSAWFPEEAACYVIAEPLQGYQIRYENIGVYAGITDCCCNGGTIVCYRIPKTGDDANLVLWVGCLLAGIALHFAMSITERKNKTHPSV